MVGRAVVDVQKKFANKPLKEIEKKYKKIASSENFTKVKSGRQVLKSPQNPFFFIILININF